MEILGLFKGKKLELYSSVSGKCINLSEANDRVFAQKMMGDGWLLCMRRVRYVNLVTAKWKSCQISMKMS